MFLIDSSKYKNFIKEINPNNCIEITITIRKNIYFYLASNLFEDLEFFMMLEFER
jgi:hypothetical protein